MPSIYPNLKFSDRKHIRTEKARIRRQFSDLVKQKELISELYKKMNAVAPEKPKAPEVKKAKPAVKKVEVKKDKKVKVK